MSEREYIEYPKDIEIETAYGPVFLNVVERDYVYVDASGNGKSITFRGKKYAVSVRLHTYDGGRTWEPTRDGRGGVDRSAIHARPWQNFNYGDEMPRTYREKVVAEITARVRDYLATRPTLRFEAGVADASNALRRAEEELAKLEEQTAAKRAEVEGLALMLSAAETARAQAPMPAASEEAGS